MRQAVFSFQDAGKFLRSAGQLSFASHAHRGEAFEERPVVDQPYPPGT